jgi:hypothetical protein
VEVAVFIRCISRDAFGHGTMSPALPTNNVVSMAIPGSRHVSRVRRCSCSACRQSPCGPGRDAPACAILRDDSGPSAVVAASGLNPVRLDGGDISPRDGSSTPTASKTETVSPRQLRHRGVSRSPPSTHAVTQHERRTPSSGQRASAESNSSSTAFHQARPGLKHRAPHVFIPC